MPEVPPLAQNTSFGPINPTMPPSGLFGAKQEQLQRENSTIASLVQKENSAGINRPKEPVSPKPKSDLQGFFKDEKLSEQKTPASPIP